MSFKPAEYPSHCEKELEVIAEAALVRLKEDHFVDLRKGEVVYTAAEVLLEEIAQYLKGHPDATIEIASLLKFSIVKNESDTGEKSGNIVPLVEIGEKFKLGVKNDDATEEDDE